MTTSPAPRTRLPPFEESIEILYRASRRQTDTDTDLKEIAWAKKTLLERIEQVRTVDQMATLLEVPRPTNKDETTVHVETCLASEDKIR